jgi:hypothetical protein
MVEPHNLIMHLRSHVGSINTNVFGELMLDRIPSNTDRTGAVRRERGVGAVADTPKSSRSHRSHVTSAVTVAIALNLALALERETVVCFLVFQAIKEEPRKTQ